MSLINGRFIKQEKEFLADAEIDYVPLYDVVRLFSDYSKLIPTEEEFLETLNFLSYLLNKYAIEFISYQFHFQQ